MGWKKAARRSTKPAWNWRGARRPRHSKRGSSPATLALRRWASVTYTRDDRTLLGDDPAKVAGTLKSAGVDVIGASCSGGPAQLLRILKQMCQAVPDGKFWVKPNAGWPEQVGGRIMYPSDAEYFGDYALSFRETGACIVGGCCGTTPQHIAAMHKALAATPQVDQSQIVIFPQEEITETVQEQPTQFAQKLTAGRF